MGPISYSIIAEASSVRLLALSTGVGRGAYVSSLIQNQVNVQTKADSE